MVKLKLPIVKNKMLFSALSAFVAFVLVWVSGSYLSKTREQVVVKRQELFALQRDLNLLDKILADTKEKEAEIVVAMRSLPSSFSEVSFAVGQFERLAQETGVNLEIGLDANTKQEPGATDSLKATLRTSSSYTSFTEMLSSLSSLPYHTRFDSIKLEGSGQTLSGLTSFRLYLPDNGN